MAGGFLSQIKGIQESKWKYKAYRGENRILKNLCRYEKKEHFFLLFGHLALLNSYPSLLFRLLLLQLLPNLSRIFLLKTGKGQKLIQDQQLHYHDDILILQKVRKITGTFMIMPIAFSFVISWRHLGDLKGFNQVYFRHHCFLSGRVLQIP